MSPSCGIAEFLATRPDVAAALKFSALDEAYYKEHREKSVEYIAEHDDSLVEKFLNGEKISADELARFHSPLDDCA